MIRKPLVESEFGSTTTFRWRGHDVSRIEGLSDAVLGFAITLIVVSLEIPRSFGDLLAVMRGFLAFAVCFALLIQVWYKHYVFFRRYGLSDLTTILLNSFLLFVILFYVYPLKFLFTLVLGGTVSGGQRPTIAIPDVPLLFTIYGIGFVALFGTFALLYLHAWRKRGKLELNSLEEFDTIWAIVDNLLYVGVGLLSIVIANTVPLRWLSLAGWCFVLLGLTGFFHGWIGGRMRERIEAAVKPDRTT